MEEIYNFALKKTEDEDKAKKYANLLQQTLINIKSEY